jgi:hypothetical protein
LSVIECNSEISLGFSKMVDRMLDKDPRKRPSPHELIQYMGETMPTRDG